MLRSRLLAERAAVAFAVTVAHPVSDLRVHQVGTAVSQPARNRLLEPTATELPAQPDWPALSGRRTTTTA
ncbi:hypothetical protein [Streptomyces sp. NPDC051576]|uniref:hypothetical protein n=1 Tax=Streptomyces sp. NPDC051576 TaxID=3155803 RepID=UPI003415BD95